MRRAGELERAQVVAIAEELQVNKIDITEIDTQESTKVASSEKFFSTWSAAALFDEVTQSEAVIAKGQGVQRLGELGCDVMAWSVSAMPDKAALYAGYVTSHEECYTLRRCLPKNSSATIRFVYQPCKQMRDCLLRDKNMETEDLHWNKEIHILGSDTVPGGYDCVGALVTTAGGAGHWCGLPLVVEDAWKACPTSNATSWLTAAGVLLGVQIILDHPDLGVCLAEDLPNSICQPGLQELGVKGWLSIPVDDMVSRTTDPDAYIPAFVPEDKVCKT